MASAEGSVYWAHVKSLRLDYKRAEHDNATAFTIKVSAVHSMRKYISYNDEYMHRLCFMMQNISSQSSSKLLFLLQMRVRNPET